MSFLNVVDLAGSERRDKNTQPTEDKENLSRNLFPGKPPLLSKCARQPRATAQETEDLQNEAKFINQSLSTLGRIFKILADKKDAGRSLPPYRESKLTHLLQPSLHYDSCKCLMIVNVWQNADQQTKEALEFGKLAMITK